ncbi:hypothetical protein [Herbaspirillum huttiense]|uniref:Uncharacterized protein n=2 Tax=Herbaspirillum huttiense TaxID=863372 RepID=A0AAJ2HIL8_9BURK|nr:hypothetical protein [Herbaspirillum huttiense]MDR9839385.1 hypothetical protein [Herbaspirillum huttiense]
MQTMSQVSKLFIFALIIFLGASSFASPTVDGKRLDAYRLEFKDAVTPVKYVFVHADGSPCCTTSNKEKPYILDITSSAPAKLASSAEIERLFKENFEVEIDNESLISTPNADYVVITMSRPAEYNKKYVPCAGGMGEERAYLLSITAGEVTVINRKFGGCGKHYRALRDSTVNGYEVSSSDPATKPVRFVLRGSTLVQQDGTSKESR